MINTITFIFLSVCLFCVHVTISIVSCLSCSKGDINYSVSRQSRLLSSTAWFLFWPNNLISLYIYIKTSLEKPRLEEPRQVIDGYSCLNTPSRQVLINKWCVCFNVSLELLFCWGSCSTFRNLIPSSTLITSSLVISFINNTSLPKIDLINFCIISFNFPLAVCLIPLQISCLGFGAT